MNISDFAKNLGKGPWLTKPPEFITDANFHQFFGLKLIFQGTYLINSGAVNQGKIFKEAVQKVRDSLSSQNRKNMIQ